jgi:uncharacterized membrane protein YoaK (UPF0700 family)
VEERLPVATGWAVGALFTLTFVTGLVDAVSYLRLGRVFVGNMTGNVVFLGLSAARDTGLPVVAPIVAGLAFVAGSLLGGRLARGRSGSRVWCGSVFLGQAAVTAVLAALIGSGALGLGGRPRLAVIALLALSLGVQTATVRRMGARDLTTTVLTQALAGFAADGRLGAGGSARSGRRLGSVLTMCAGAAAGALLLQVTVAGVIGTAAALTGAAAGVFFLAPGPAPLPERAEAE